jgi:hypothetical protein
MRKQFDAILISCNLTSKVQIKKKSSTAIGKVFIDTLKFNNYTTDSMINGLPNHDAQL